MTRGLLVTSGSAGPVEGKEAGRICCIRVFPDFTAAAGLASPRTGYLQEGALGSASVSAGRW